MTTRSNRRGERGAALIVTIILISALLAGGMLAIYLMVADTRSAQYINEGRGALFCAESGLAGAREYITNNANDWPDMLNADAGDDPDGYPVEGDLDGDEVMDWHVELRDNDDEFPTNDPTVDADSVVFMVSTCLKYPDTPREVMQLISIAAGGTNYRNQSGQGAGGTNNAN